MGKWYNISRNMCIIKPIFEIYYFWYSTGWDHDIITYYCLQCFIDAFLCIEHVITHFSFSTTWGKDRVKPWYHDIYKCSKLNNFVNIEFHDSKTCANDSPHLKILWYKLLESEYMFEILGFSGWKWLSRSWIVL